MPINTFSVTAALLQSDRLPNYPAFDGNSSPTSTAVGTIITRCAARLCGRIQAWGINPSTLDSVGEPVAFSTMQSALLSGVAYTVALAFLGKKHGDRLVDSWRSEWKEVMEGLLKTQLAKTLLIDAWPGTAGGIRTHVQHGSISTTTATDIEVDDPEFVGDMDL